MPISKYMIVVAFSLFWGTAGVQAGEELIQLGAHVHGHGELNMALEGQRLEMELKVPGMDIVGFEHEAHSEQQKAADSKARQILARGQKLFGLPQAAQCKQVFVKVSFVHEEAHEEHGAFRTEYQFDCAAPQQLTSLHFAFFSLFPNSQELAVTFVTAKNQQSFEVKRDHPALEGLTP